MGAVYYVEVKVKLKDETSAIAALNQHMVNDKRTNYGLPEFEKHGITPDTFDNLMRIFLADHQNSSFQIDRQKRTTCYQNSFEASYGWESVLIEMFETLTPYLENGSSIKIWPDSGCVKYSIKNGQCVLLK